MIKRLLRDFKSQRGWVIALVALIALSSGIYSSFRSTYDSGIGSLDSADEELNSADILVSVPPTHDFSQSLENISDVSMVSPAFATDTYTFVDNERVRGEITGVQLGKRVNDYQILKGEDLEGENDVVVEHHFAEKHGVDPGQEITLYIRGTPTDFEVSGICFSPRHVYLISREGGVQSDFGIFYVSRGAISESVNTFYIKVSDESKVDSVKSNVNSFFENRAIDAVVKPSDELFTYIAFREDLRAMNSLADIFSIVLLTIFAFILFVILSRVVMRKRHEIGTLRAMGFSKWNVFSYYLSFSAIAVILGVVLSIPIAYGLLSLIMNYWGVTVLSIPSQFIAYNLDATYIAYGAIFAAIFAVAGAFFPSYRAASFKPAEAMRPYIASQKKSARVLSKSSISPTNKLIFRDIFGRKGRSISTLVVVALILGLGLSFPLSMGSFEEGIRQRFNNNELWDVRVSFNAPQDNSALNTLSKISGVESVEPYTSYGAEISHASENVIVQLRELGENTKLRRFSFAEGELASGDVIVSGDVAHRLDASVGDNVLLSTPTGTKEVEVSGVLEELGSSEGYLIKDITNPAGVLLGVKDGDIDQVENSLQNLSFVKSWTKKEELLGGWLKLMDEYQGMVYMFDLIVILLVAMVIGSIAFISTMEREWEFVVLKSMGFSNWTILRGNLLETLGLSSIGVLLGIPLGMQLASAFSGTWESLMSPPPTIFIPDVAVLRIILVAGASLLTVFLVTRSILVRDVAERLRRVFETM